MAYKQGESGNPKGRPVTPAGKFKREIAAARQLMGGALEPIAQAVVDAATGLPVLLVPGPEGVGLVRATSPGQVDDALAADTPVYRIYLQDPDLRAAVVAFERIMGKVPQPVDVTLRQVIDTATADQELLARVLQEHVPAEHLEPVLAELRRVRDHRRRAAAVLAGVAAS